MSANANASASASASASANANGNANAKTNSSDRNLSKDAALAAHKRNVSWGLDADGNKKKSDSFLYQPELNDDGGDVNGTGHASTPPPPQAHPGLLPKPYQQRQKSAGAASNASATLTPQSHHQQGQGHVRQNTRITLTDITANPLEDEAENAIIRALEKRDWEDRHNNEDLELEWALHGGDRKPHARADSARIGIMSGIPDAALAMVQEEQEKEVATRVAAGVAAARTTSSNSSIGYNSAGSKSGDDVTATPTTKAPPSPRPPRSPKARPSPHTPHSPMSSPRGGRMKFEDIANQLKNAQAGGGAGDISPIRASSDGTTGGYLLKAAAAYRNAQPSTRNLNGGGVADKQESTPLTRLAKLKGDKNDSDSEEGPISAGDAMVKNMNIMLGLPNKNEGNKKEEEDMQREEAERRRKASDAFDEEAQVEQPRPTASARWNMVREHVKGEGMTYSAAEAFKSAGEAGAAARAEEDTKPDGGGPVSPSGTTGSSKKEKKGSLWLGCIPRSVFCFRCFKQCFSINENVRSALLVHFKKLVKYLVGFIILPGLFVSAILFYAADNPMPGTKKERLENPTAYASFSWWVMFICCRQVCTLALSRFTEVLMVDVLTLHTRTTLKFFGPFVSLLTIQARGWPYIITFWAIWDFALLHGKHVFARHWLYWTNLGWFSTCDFSDPENPVVYPDCNPSGGVTYSNVYFRILISLIVFGCCVALKRVGLALYQGKKSTGHYGPQLEKLMKRMLLITEIANLATEIEAAYECSDSRGLAFAPAKAKGFDFKKLRARRRGDDDSESGDSEDEVESSAGRSQASQPSPPASPAKSSPKNSSEDPPLNFFSAPQSVSTNIRESMMRYRTNTEDFQSTRTFTTTRTRQGSVSSNPDETRNGMGHRLLYSVLGESAQLKLTELLGEWEEPAVTTGHRSKMISIQHVLQFRQAVLCLDSKYPFSYSFGPANTRESCIESAQDVYSRLHLHIPNQTLLQFDTLALICLDKDGDINEKKARKLIRLFRPARDGTLTALDFVKSCDKVYKDLRTLRAAIANSSQLDLAFESLVNIGFYFLLFMLVLTIIELDPWTLFLSLSGFILSFSFMFGNAASKYFEGILLILVQKPYDIGDRIHVSNSQIDTSSDGSATWFVEGVNLYSTTVRYAATNEVATHSNGSLSASRIINAARSPKAQVYVTVKFACDVPYERVMLFKSVIEEFVKERPREWLSMGGFRATRVEADLGYIEYKIVLQHVEKWQNIGPVLNSKAEVASYCLEVQKKLGMRYQAPPLPVNLGINKAEQMEQSVFESEQIGEEPSNIHSEPDFSMLSSLFSKPEPKKTK